MIRISSQIVIDIERPAVVAQNGIPLLSQKDVGRADGADAPCLLNRPPVLEQAHQTCDAIVRGGIHQLIHHVAVRNSEMRQRTRVVVDHDRNRSLVLNLLADRLSGQFTVIHIIGKNICLFGFLLSRGIFLLPLPQVLRMCAVRDGLKSMRRNALRGAVSTGHDCSCGHYCQYYCKYSLLHAVRSPS